MNMPDKRPLKRINILKWLRRTHAWVGLWGAVLGLLFGVTGILLNHRAVMKIEAGKNIETQTQIVLDAQPESPQALADLLATRFSYPPEQVRARKEGARSVIWNGRTVRQPERWSISFDAPDRFARAEYWAGNNSVSVKSFDPDSWSLLKRLHTGAGQGTLWILLADALAGGIVFLCLSGTLLWSRLSGPKLLGASLVAGGAGFGLWAALSAMS